MTDLDRLWANHVENSRRMQHAKRALAAGTKALHPGVTCPEIIHNTAPSAVIIEEKKEEKRELTLLMPEHMDEQKEGPLPVAAEEKKTQPAPTGTPISFQLGLENDPLLVTGTTFKAARGGGGKRVKTKVDSELDDFVLVRVDTVENKHVVEEKKE